MKFEVVYTVTDWYDGPLRGIANHKGAPHLFECEWSEREEYYHDTFLLMPIDRTMLKLALEDWAIWRRYETAFYKGKIESEHHPSLPDERNRHLQIEALLKERLIVDPSVALRKKAEFRVRKLAIWNGYGMRPLKVCWTDVECT